MSFHVNLGEGSILAFPDLLRSLCAQAGVAPGPVSQKQRKVLGVRENA